VAEDVIKKITEKYGLPEDLIEVSGDLHVDLMPMLATAAVFFHWGVRVGRLKREQEDNAWMEGLTKEGS
jgi:hypothetical protein